MLPRFYQMSWISSSSESVALSKKGCNFIEHSQDCRLDVAEPQHHPTLQTCFWYFLYVAWHCSASKYLLVDQSRVLLLQRFVDTLQLTTVKFGTDGTTIRNQLKMHDSFKVPPNTWLSCQNRSCLETDGASCPFLNSLLVSILLDKSNPFLIWCHNVFPKKDHPMDCRVIDGKFQLICWFLLWWVCTDVGMAFWTKSSCIKCRWIVDLPTSSLIVNFQVLDETYAIVPSP